MGHGIAQYRYDVRFDYRDIDGNPWERRERGIVTVSESTSMGQAMRALESETRSRHEIPRDSESTWLVFDRA